MERIRLQIDIEGMRVGVERLLNQYFEENGSIAQKAIEQALTLENMERIISQAADREIKSAIDEEIKRFYRYGKGQKLLHSAIEKRMAEDIEALS